MPSSDQADLAAGARLAATFLAAFLAAGALVPVLTDATFLATDGADCFLAPGALLTAGADASLAFGQPGFRLGPDYHAPGRAPSGHAVHKTTTAPHT